MRTICRLKQGNCCDKKEEDAVSEQAAVYSKFLRLIQSTEMSLVAIAPTGLILAEAQAHMHTHTSAGKVKKRGSGNLFDLCSKPTAPLRYPQRHPDQAVLP